MKGVSDSLNEKIKEGPHSALRLATMYASLGALAPTLDGLVQTATLLCVSSRGRTNPRMVKRRNSPYASHDRALLLNRMQIFHPELLPPLALSKRKSVSQAKKPFI